MSKVIIVTGTPGVGKTVFAKLLAKETDSRYLNVEEMVRKEKLYRRFDRSSKSFIVDIRRLRQRLLKQLDEDKGKGLVVDSHLLNGLMPSRPNMVAIVLRLDPLVLAQRLRARGWDRKKIWDNVEAELIDLPLYEAWTLLRSKRIFEIDATSRSPRTLVKGARKLIVSARRFRGVTVDWLSQYDPVELSRRIS